MDISECFKHSKDGLNLLSALMKIDLNGAMDSLISEVRFVIACYGDPRLLDAEAASIDAFHSLQLYDLHDLLGLHRSVYGSCLTCSRGDLPDA